MFGRLILFVGAAAFAGLFASAAAAASHTTVTTSHSTVHSGPHSDESTENPEDVPDTEDMDQAEREIRQQMHDARMKVIHRGGQIIVSMGADILFTYDSYDVSNEGTAAARVLARVLNHHRRSTVDVNGYTDTHGSDEYNDRLSENRANAVAQILMQNGVDESRISTHGFGETHLAVNTPDETKEIKNRRVEIVIHPGRHGLGHVRGGHRRHRHHHNDNRGDGDDD